MAIINKSTTCAGKDVEKREPLCTVGGNATGIATVENSMEFPQTLKMGLPFDSVIPLLGIYPRNPKTPIQNNLCTSVFIAALFIYNSQDLETA